MSQVIWFDRSLGAPTITVAEYGIVFNRAAVEIMGQPEHVILGFIPGTKVILARAAEEVELERAFPFRSKRREQDGSVRISNKDFIRLLEDHMELDLQRAIRCIARLDRDSGILSAQIPDEAVAGNQADAEAMGHG